MSVKMLLKLSFKILVKMSVKMSVKMWVKMSDKMSAKMSVKMLLGIKFGGGTTYIEYTGEICEYINSYSSICILLCLYKIAISNKFFISNVIYIYIWQV